MCNKPQSLGVPYVPPLPSLLYLMKWVLCQVKTGLLQPYPIPSSYSSHLLGTVLNSIHLLSLVGPASGPLTLGHH